MAAYETCSKESWKLYWLRDNCFTIQSSHLDNLQGSNNASNGKLLRFFSANISLVTGEMLHFLFSHHQGTVSIQPTTNASLSSAPNLKRPCWRLFTRPKRVAATAAYSGKDVRKKRWELERKKKRENERETKRTDHLVPIISISQQYRKCCSALSLIPLEENCDSLHRFLFFHREPRNYVCVDKVEEKMKIKNVVAFHRKCLDRWISTTWLVTAGCPTWTVTPWRERALSNRRATLITWRITASTIQSSSASSRNWKAASSRPSTLFSRTLAQSMIAVNFASPHPTAATLSTTPILARTSAVSAITH